MSALFEYSKWMPVNEAGKLKHLLKNIWQQSLADYEELLTEGDKTDTRYQPFLQFDGNSIRANNFIGFVQTEKDLVEIYPKVFRNNPATDKAVMLRHIFYWLSYCRKWKFPFIQISMDTDEIDQFPELIIHLMAKQFFEILSTQPFMKYQAAEDAFTVPRGRINFSRYISQSLSKGYYHQLECDHEPFVFDNKINRIIKCCVRILEKKSKLSETINLLWESLHILDEVEDVSCTAADLHNAPFNRLYEDYSMLMDNCEIILNQLTYSPGSDDLSQWCLLLPMEYIFEDFVAGFLKKHFSDDWIVEYQKSEAYLSNDPRAFNMQHDIFLTSRKNKDVNIIIDTKYKMRPPNFKDDVKKGIAQADLYQMVSYAYKRGCTKVLLLYPNITETLQGPHTFKIGSGFPGGELIEVTAIEIPFWGEGGVGVLEGRLKDFMKGQLQQFSNTKFVL